MRHIEKPKIDQDLLESIRNAEVNDTDGLFGRVIKIAVNIDRMPRDCEMKNEDLACLFLAWNEDNGHFSDGLGLAGIDPTLIFELGFINCCILEALDTR